MPVSFIRKLRYIIPDIPRRRFNICCGSNTKEEWLLALRLLVSVDVNNDLGAVGKYEELFARLTGSRYAFSFGAGRMALFAILEALGVGKDDEIIIPAFTCVVVANAILYRGAKPVYVDIDPYTFNIDVKKIEPAITRRTKALYAQHTFGLPCDVKRIREVADRHGLAVIEDGALALGSFAGSMPVGSLANAAFFSTDRTKTISTHVGGMAVTNDPIVADKLGAIQQRAPFLDDFTVRRILLTFLLEYVLFSARMLWIGRAIHIVMMKTSLLFHFRDELDTAIPSAYPFPCRLSSAQAEIGIRQLEGLRENVKHRHEIVDYLESKIKWNVSRLDEIERSALLRYSFLVDDRKAFEARFHRYFDLGIWFTSVLQCREHNLDLVGYRTGSCPVAEYVTRHIVNFPTHARIPIEILTKEVDENWQWLESQITRECPIR
jgi:dTDP-4-amino-4,6-dideoxygalactose transaminase